MEINKSVEFCNNVIRTVIAVDGTGSMGGVLSKIINILKEMMERTEIVLKEKKVNINIEIMLMIYRNYNSSHAEVLESTPFESSLDNLFKFMSKVAPKGGWGNEAVELTLQAVNKLDQVSQMILIGDAAWNQINEVKAKRASKGEGYWT
jgi:hypothetical protein